MLKLPYENSKAWLQQRIADLQESKANTEDYVEHDEKHYARFGWLILIVGFGGFMLWAAFAPLDKGVPASGTVIADGQRKIIQAPLAGVVEEILVRDGSVVKAGEVLARLNNLQATAQVTGADQAVTGLRSQVKALEISVTNQEAQEKTLKEQLSNMQELAQEGFVPRNRVLELQRNYHQLSATLAENRGNLARYRSQLTEQESRLAAFRFDLNNTEIKSPVDGSVVNLEVFTKGAVVQTGFKLMEVQPSNADLVIETRVPVHLIDKVHPDLKVEIIFSAFNQRSTPNIPGVVTVVPDERTLDQRTGEPFYKVQVQVTEQGKKMLRDNKVRPGMPAEVFIVTGERSFLSYLLKPLTDRMHFTFTEE